MVTLGPHRRLFPLSLPLPYPFLLLSFRPPLIIILTRLIIGSFVACRVISYLSLLTGFLLFLHLSHSILCHLSHTNIPQGPCQWTSGGHFLPLLSPVANCGLKIHQVVLWSTRVELNFSHLKWSRAETNLLGLDIIVVKCLHLVRQSLFKG